MSALDDAFAEVQSQQPAQVIPQPGSASRPDLSLQPPAPPETALQKVGKAIASVTDPIGRAVSDPLGTGAAIGAGIVRAPGLAAGGLADTLADTDKFLRDNMSPAFVRALPAPAQAALALSGAARAANNGKSLGDTLSMRQGLGSVGNKDINEFTAQGVAVGLSFLTGTGEEKAASVGAGEVEQALAPTSRLAAKVGQLAINSGKVGAATAIVSNSKDLTERAQAGLEGAAANLVAEPLLGVLTGLVKAGIGPVTTGTARDAVKDAMDRGFATARTNEAAFQSTEASAAGETLADAKPVTPNEALPQGTRKGDANTRSDPYADGRAAMAKAGVPEDLSPSTHPLTPSGRIPVSPAAKGALDQAGLGHAFANREDPLAKDPVIFKAPGPDGRVYGTMEQEDLNGLVSDAQAFADKATREGGRAIDVANARVGEWRIGNLGTSFDVPGLLAGVIDRIPGIERPLSDLDLHKAIQAGADAIGYEPEDMAAYAATIAGDVSKMPAAVGVVRTMWARAASDADFAIKVHPDWSALAGDHPDVKAALQAVKNMMDFTTSVEEVKSGVGRALRTWSLPDTDTYLANFGRVPQEELANVSVPGSSGMPPIPRNPQELQQWSDAWNFTKGDPKARADFLKGLTFTPSKWLYLRSSLANFFTASIISAPSTFMRDLLGPATIGILRTLERTSGGLAGSINPFLDQATREDLRATGLAAPGAYLETLGAMRDSLAAAVKAFGSEDARLSGPRSGPYDFNSHGIPASLIDAATAANGKGQVTGSLPYVMGNAINAWPQFIHALHGGVNEFAQRLSYLGEVRASAYLEAAQKDLSGQDLTDYVRTRLTNSFDPLTDHGLDANALKQSARTTLIQPVGNRDTSPIVAAFNKTVQQMRTNFPESRYVLPIFTVPANALGEALRRIPGVGQLFGETQNELLGKAGIKAQAEAYGRVMSGASLLMGGLTLARAGLLTGAGPSTPAARALWEAQGFEPYSVKIGGTWVSYNRLDVVGQMLAVPGIMYDRSVHTQMDNQNAAFAGVGALAEYFKDQAALQGISELMSLGNSPQETQSVLKRFAQGTFRGFVPNFITQLGRNNLDADKRTIRNPIEAVFNALPGASAMLDPQRNVLGEEDMKVQNAGFNTLPVSLSPANTYAKDPTLDELYRLYSKTGYAPGVKSPALPGAKEDMRDIKLEDGHSLYEHLMSARSTATDDNGMSLRENLQALINSPEYAQAVDAGADHRQVGGNMDNMQDSRGALIAQTFRDFDKQTERQVANESPLGRRYLAVAKAKAIDSPELRDHSTEDLVHDPKLLDALGIDIGAFEDKVSGN